MPFDISISNQSIQFEHRIKNKLYHSLFEASKTSRWVRITGFGVGVAAALVTIALRIAYIFELLIKGIANLIGAACNKKCKAKLGVEQLFKALPLALGGLAVSIVMSPYHIANKTMRVAIEPKDFLSNRWMVHNKEFQVLVEAAKNNNMVALVLLGLKFAETEGLPNKEQVAFDAYEKAAEAGYIPAVCQLALCYQRGKGVAENKAKAIEMMQYALNADPKLVEHLQTVATDKYWKPVLDFIEEHQLKPKPAEPPAPAEAAKPPEEVADAV